MNCHGVIGVISISSAQSHGNRCAAFFCPKKNQLIALPQTSNAEAQITQLIVLVGIGAGLIKNQLRFEIIKHRRYMFFELAQVLLVLHMVRQMNIEVTLLFDGVKIILMN